MSQILSVSNFTPSQLRDGQTVQLFVEARNLADLDIITMSDPFCTLKVRRSGTQYYSDCGRTETIDNDLNPLWIDSFKVKYIPSAQQELLFEVWDDDYPDRELIGVCEVLF